MWFPTLNLAVSWRNEDPEALRLSRRDLRVSEGSSEAEVHRVSVVITSYNLEHLIDVSVGSVLGQTRPADEVIVTDDCSTDRTRERLAAYGNKIRVLAHAQNRGALRNTLAGLEATTGDVVAFLDGDDVWAPTKLEKLTPLFERDPRVVIASHDHRRIDLEGRALAVEDDTNRNVARIARRPESEWSDLFRDSIIFRKGYWFGSAYMLRRSAIDLAGFNAVVQRHPDVARYAYLDTALGPYVTASNPDGKVGFVDEVLFDYRVQGTSSSTVDRSAALRSIRNCQAVNKLTRLALETVNSDPRIPRRFEELDAVHELSKKQYEGRRLAAIAQFLRMSSQLHADHLLRKELGRLAATTILGVDGFLKLKNRYA